MKKILLFLLVSATLFGCVSRLYLGQNRDGHLTLNNTVYYGTRDGLDSLISISKERGVKLVTPPFRIADDMVLVSEYETYKYKPTKGHVLYHRNQKHAWKRVVFLVDVECVEYARCIKDTVFVSVRGVEQRFVLVPASSRYDEKYVRL